MFKVFYYLLRSRNLFEISGCVYPLKAFFASYLIEYKPLFKEKIVKLNFTVNVTMRKMSFSIQATKTFF